MVVCVCECVYYIEHRERPVVQMELLLGVSRFYAIYIYTLRYQFSRKVLDAYIAERYSFIPLVLGGSRNRRFHVARSSGE